MEDILDKFNKSMNSVDENASTTTWYADNIKKQLNVKHKLLNLIIKIYN